MTFPKTFQDLKVKITRCNLASIANCKKTKAREDRQPPKAPEKTPSNLSKKYGPLSLTPNKDVTEGTAAAGPVLHPRRDRTPPPPPTVARKPVSVFSSEAFRPPSASSESRKRFNTDTKPKASSSTSKKKKKSTDGLDSNDQSD